MTARIFVGTDERQQLAERALERSIRAHASIPFTITWMRAGEPGWVWKGSPDIPWPDVPYPRNKPLGHPKTGQWATKFTCFRYAIPELCEFEGRAIYLDSDMLVLGDIAELWHHKVKKGWACINAKRTDVSVIDCGKFRGVSGWPSLQEMKESMRPGGMYRQLLQNLGLMEFTVPRWWDDMDSYTPGRTKLIHYTWMPTQPWKPWPEKFGGYEKHKHPAAEDQFWKWADEQRPR